MSDIKEVERRLADLERRVDEHLRKVPSAPDLAQQQEPRKGGR